MAETTARNFCRHLHLSGRRCGSPALRGENFCYFHHTTRKPPKHLGQNPLDAVFSIPRLEDADIIQHTVSDILARIATNSIDAKRARLLLFGLNVAALNLARGCRASRSLPEPRSSEVNAVIEDLELDPTLGPLAPVARMDDPAQDETRKTLMQKFVEYCERPPHACKECARRVVIDANKAEGRRLMAELNRRRAANLPEYDPPLNFHTPYPADQAWGAEERRQGLSAGLPLPYPAAPSEAPSAESKACPERSRRDPETANTTPTAHTVLPTTAGAPSMQSHRMGGSSFAEANDRTPYAEANDQPAHQNRHPDPEPVEAEEPVLSPSKEPASAFSTPPPHAESPNEPGLPNPTPDTWAKFAAHLPNLKAAAEEAGITERENATPHRPANSVQHRRPRIANQRRRPTLNPRGIQ